MLSRRGSIPVFIGNIAVAAAVAAAACCLLLGCVGVLLQRYREREREIEACVCVSQKAGRGVLQAGSVKLTRVSVRRESTVDEEGTTP